MHPQYVQTGARRLSQRLMALSDVAKSGSETPDRALFSGLAHLIEELAEEAKRLAEEAASDRTKT